MGYNAKVGSFNIDTTKTAGQTQAITDVGFQPKIVLFWWSGSTATGDEVAGGNILSGFGAIDGTSQFDLGIYSLDGGASSSTSRDMNAGYCISEQTATGVVSGSMSYSSFDSDGFTLLVSNQFDFALRISYLALGGTDLTNTKIGNFDRATSTGEYSRTGIGFKPDMMLFVSSGFTVASNNGNNINICIGMASSSSNRGVIGLYSQNGQTTTNTTSYGYNGEVIGLPSGSNIVYRDTLVSFNDDGFTLNNLEGTTAYYVHYIALKGGQYSVGDLTTRTDGNDIAETVGFQPTALLFASANRALSTQDAATDHARISIGAATSTSNRAVQAINDEDNLADSETAHANYDSAVYANIADDAIVGLMDLKSIDDDGFTCVMDDADPSECWVTYLAIGATEEGGGDVEVVTVMEVNTVPVNVTTVITEEC